MKIYIDPNGYILYHTTGLRSRKYLAELVLLVEGDELRVLKDVRKRNGKQVADAAVGVATRAIGFRAELPEKESAYLSALRCASEKKEEQLLEQRQADDLVYDQRMSEALARSKGDFDHAIQEALKAIENNNSMVVRSYIIAVRTPLYTGDDGTDALSDSRRIHNAAVDAMTHRITKHGLFVQQVHQIVSSCVAGESTYVTNIRFGW